MKRELVKMRENGSIHCVKKEKLRYDLKVRGGSKLALL
jgi:hypothetical protein